MKFAKDTENLNKKFHTTLTVHFTWIYHNAQAVKGLKFFYDFRDIDSSLLLGAVWIHVLRIHVLRFPLLLFLAAVVDFCGSCALFTRPTNFIFQQLFH